MIGLKYIILNHIYEHKDIETLASEYDIKDVYRWHKQLFEAGYLVTTTSDAGYTLSGKPVGTNESFKLSAKGLREIGK